MRKMKNFCKRNFSDSQNLFRFEPHSDSDSSLTDQNIAKYSKISTFWWFPWFFAMWHFLSGNRLLGTALSERYAYSTAMGERFSWRMNNFCKMNFSYSQKIFFLERHSDSDSSLTDQNTAKYQLWEHFEGFPWFFAMWHFLVKIKWWVRPYPRG